MNIGRNPARLVVAEALKSLKSALVGIALLGIPINLLMLTGPLFMLQVYDRVLASGSVPTLVVLGILTLGLFTFYGLLEGIRARVLLRIGQKLDTELSNVTYESAVSLPLYLGSQATRVDPIRDLDAVKHFLGGPGPSAIFDIPWIPFYLAIIFMFHPILGFVATGGAILICILIVLNELFSRKPSSEAAQHGLERARMAEAGRQNFEVVRAMGMLSAFREHWSAHNETFLESQQRAADTSSFFSTLIKSFRFMLQSAVLGTGAWLAIINEVSPGVIIAGSILTSRALSPVEQAVAQWRGFLAARQGLKRLRETVDQRPAEPERTDLPLPRKTLAADNVVSGKGNQAFLKGVSFALRAGEGLGVIGPTGAGKTSLARTLVGVYPILRGEIRADGADLYQWSDERQGDFIGYLPQNIQLFDGTVAQNIARFRKEAKAVDIIEAAELADAHALITSLPEGYDTVIGATGLTLSGGQMQRVALARALYGKPFLVILDEPNSNLDADGEAALTGAIKTMLALNSIVVVIAHRPSAIQGVDKLLFIKDGRSQAFGPKDEVLKQVLGPQPKIVVTNEAVPRNRAAQ